MSQFATYDSYKRGEITADECIDKFFYALSNYKLVIEEQRTHILHMQEQIDTVLRRLGE